MRSLALSDAAAREAPEKWSEKKEQESLYFALSEARRRIQHLTEEQTNLPGNDGVVYFAQNPENQLLVRFKEDGSVLLESSEQESDWKATFRLLGAGAPEAIHSEQNTVAIEYPNGIVEWYKNRSVGVEQGWVIGEKPAQSDEVSIPLSLEGLYGGLSEDGLQFQTALGEPVLNYNQLKAWDSDGKTLEASIIPNSLGFEILVATAEARYPVFVDPIISTLEAKLRPEVSGYAIRGDRFGSAISLYGNTAVVGSIYDDDAEVNAGSVFVFAWNGVSWIQEAKLTASDAVEGQYFGASVSIDGDTVLIGAYLDGSENSGSAYVFTRTNGVWTEQAKLTASDAGDDDNFGFAVSLDGDSALIGAYRDDDGGSSSGSAYVFVRDGNVWTEQDKLTADDAASSDWFGYTVDLSGDSALVGAFLDDDAGSRSGSAYVFTRSGDTWSQQAKLTADDAAAGDDFGSSISIDGDTAVVGAYADDDLASSSGSVYVYIRSDGLWTQESKLTASDGEAYSYFGRSVSIDGDRLFVGAEQDDGGASQSGSLYVFERSEGTWSEEDKIVIDEAYYGLGHAVSLSGNRVLAAAWLRDDCNSNHPNAVYSYDFNGLNWIQAELKTDENDLGDGSEFIRFGYSVSLDRDTALVGAYRDYVAGVPTGSAYVLTRGGSIWSLNQILAATDGASSDFFGIAVSLDSGTAIIGASSNDDAGSASGSAYVFTSSGADWQQQAKLTANDAAAGDFFGGAVSLDAETAVIGARGDDDAGSFTGSAYVFVRDGSLWTQQAKLTADDAEEYDYFGKSVSIDTDTTLIGAYGDDDGGSYSGSAYVFTRVNDVWTQQAKLTADDAASTDYFGYSVSVDGDTALIGSYLNDEAGTNSGSAYVFIQAEGLWEQQVKLLGSDSSAYDRFGSSVSLDVDTALVSARRDFLGGRSEGSAYLFIRNGSIWTEYAKFTPPQIGSSFEYGNSVSVSGDTALIGCSDESGIDAFGGGSQDQGSAYVYRFSLPTSDTDGDGASDAFETLHGFDETVSGDWMTKDSDLDGSLDLLEIYQGTDKDNPSSKYGVFTLAESSASDSFVLSIQRSAVPSGVIAVAKWSTDLENWYVSGTNQGRMKVDLAEEVVSSNSQFETVEMTATVTGEFSGQVFFRFELLPME